jgi:hypothetical protein
MNTKSKTLTCHVLLSLISTPAIIIIAHLRLRLRLRLRQLITSHTHDRAKNEIQKTNTQPTRSYVKEKIIMHRRSQGQQKHSHILLVGSSSKRTAQLLYCGTVRTVVSTRDSFNNHINLYIFFTYLLQ